MFPVVVGLERSYCILHGSVSGRPFGDIGEVGGDIPVLDRITESDRAPEGLNVAEHLAAKSPDAGHPVAVPAPEQIIADESVVFVAGEVDPLGGTVGGESAKPRNSWVEQDLRNPDLGKNENSRRLNHEAELIAEGAQHTPLRISECPSLPSPQ